MSAERPLGARGRGDLVARGLEDRGQHVAEEGRSRRRAGRSARRPSRAPGRPRPVVVRERQIVGDVDDLGGAAADHRRADEVGAVGDKLDVEPSSTMSTISSTTRPIERSPSEKTTRACVPSRWIAMSGRPRTSGISRPRYWISGRPPTHSILRGVDLLEPRHERQRHRLEALAAAAEDEQRHGLAASPAAPRCRRRGRELLVARPPSRRCGRGRSDR